MANYEDHEHRIQDHEHRIRGLEGRMNITETKVDEMRQDIKEIRKAQEKLLWWIMGTMGSVLVSIFLIIITFVTNQK